MTDSGAGSGSGTGAGDRRADRWEEAVTGTVRRALGQPDATMSVRALTGGASRRTWVVELSTPDPGEGETRRLVVQGAVPGGTTIGSMDREGRLLVAAARTGVPVPSVVAAGDDGPLGGPFLVTGWLDGETLPGRIFGDGRLAEGVARLHDQAAAALAAVHRIDPEGLDLPEVDPLEPYRAVLEASGQAHPALEWAYRWLVAHRPPPGPPVVVHGDFRLGNLMVGPRGLVAVLDWELAHLGDAYEDLAWPLVRAWRFDRVRPPGAFPDRDAWRRAYARETGHPVDEAVLRWWEVAATFRWGVICITQWLRHRDGMARSVELAAIGRRVVETEYDLMELLTPGVVAPAGTEQGDPSPGQLPAPSRTADPGTGLPPPDAAELLGAVHRLLADDVLPATEGALRHQVRVAANVVAQLEREARAGPALAERHAARLAALGATDDAALAEAVRRGELDGHPDAARLLAEDAADRLSVVNPAWLPPAP